MIEIRRIEEQCNNCLLCVRDCVAGVWREINGQAMPVAPELCNGCSHCLAVCPKEAIVHSLLKADQVNRVVKKQLDAEVYEMIVKSRRSVRRYKDEPVPADVIEKLIETTRYSPSASNSQHVAYLVVTDRELLTRVSRHVFNWGVQLHRWSGKAPGRLLLKLFGRTGAVQSLKRYLSAMEYYIEQTAAGRDFILHNAPVLMLLTSPRGAAFSADNCNIAAANLINLAHASGLGSCYIGFLVLALGRSGKLRKMLDIPPNRRVHVCLALGYPAYNHTFTVSRKKPAVTWR